MQWLNSLEPMLRAYWITALVATLIFAVQTVLTFMGVNGGDGADGLDGMDADFGGHTDTDMHADGAFPVLSVRNLVNFCLGFGWGGVCFYQTFTSPLAVIVCAFLTGIAFVVLFFVLIRMFLRLGRDNTFSIGETLNQTADVYLGIPAGKSGRGKIQLSVRGSVHELEALTDGEPLPTGVKARITRIVDEQTVIVTRIQ